MSTVRSFIFPFFYSFFLSPSLSLSLSALFASPCVHLFLCITQRIGIYIRYSEPFTQNSALSLCISVLQDAAGCESLLPLNDGDDDDDDISDDDGNMTLGADS